MQKKLISIICILFLTGASAPSLFQLNDCQNSCCDMPESCLMMDMPADCPMTMSDCGQVILFPVVTAPLTNFNQQIDLSTELVQNPILVHFTDNSFGSLVYNIPQPEPPPGQLTPLRI